MVLVMSVEVVVIAVGNDDSDGTEVVLSGKQLIGKRQCWCDLLMLRCTHRGVAAVTRDNGICARSKIYIQFALLVSNRRCH